MKKEDFMLEQGLRAGTSFRFHEWPETALISVAKRFIQDVDSLPKDYQDSVAEFMAYVHTSVNEMSAQYLTVHESRARN
jgi:hypothetical protein